jgi:hypothetical protein
MPTRRILFNIPGGDRREFEKATSLVVDCARQGGKQPDLPPVRAGGPG